ncbi:DUF1428 family protein [Candidatus Bathyarchaeota archaeon]|nr:DUF1428 family protein [Candidatus Bathyarchaeota archaeon]
MTNYLDGFVFPIPRKHLDQYRNVAEKVAKIWKEHGALAYFEYVGDDLYLEGTRSFPEFLKTKEDEVIIFGWVVFPSKEIRDLANKKVPTDPRMAELVTRITNPEKLIFDDSRMVYGGFQPLIQSNGS